MADVLKAYPDDFKRVYPLLTEFENPRFTENDWRRIFFLSWKPEEDYVGYMLVDKDVVVGYLGYIFSSLTVDGVVRSFCNLTSWIVRKQYRGQSLYLFYPSMKLENHIITDFSPTPAVFKMFEKRYKFSILDKEMVFAYPRPTLNKPRTISFDNDIPESLLSDEDRRIFADHQNLLCNHLIIYDGENYCFVVLKHKRFRKVRYMELLFVSNPSLLARYGSAVINSVCLHYKVLGLLAEKRLLRNSDLPMSFTSHPYVIKLYKSSQPVDPAMVTHLYSEKILL